MYITTLKCDAHIWNVFLDSMDILLYRHGVLLCLEETFAKFSGTATMCLDYQSLKLHFGYRFPPTRERACAVS